MTLFLVVFTATCCVASDGFDDWERHELTITQHCV